MMTTIATGRSWMRRAQWSGVTGLALLMCCKAVADQPTTQPETTQPDWQARFLAEAPGDWKKLETMVGHSQGSFDETYVVDGKARTRRLQYVIDDQVDGGKFDITGVPDDGTEHLYGFNRQYDFEIGRNRRHQKLHISKFARVDDHGQRDGELVRRRNADGIRRLQAAEWLWCFNLRELINGELGTLKSVTPIQVDGHVRLRLDFNRWQRKTHEPRLPAWAVVDPNLHWAITAYEERDQTGGTRGTVEYQPEITDVAFPKRITEEDVDPAGKVQAAKTCEFSKPEPSQSVEKDFSLEAYGLEPPRQNTP